MSRKVSCCLALAAVFACSYCATAVAETIAQGTVYRTGSYPDNGFPNFLDNVNATTLAVNLGGAGTATQTLSGVTVTAVGAGGIANVLTFSGSTIYAAQSFNPLPNWNWSGDSQAAAKNNIANNSLVAIANPPGGWTLNVNPLVVTSGQQYHVELLHVLMGGESGAYINVGVSLDGGTTYTPYATNMIVNNATAATTVYEFDVTPGSQGVKINLQRGVNDAGSKVGYPYLSAMSVTAVPEPGTIGLLATGLLGLLAYAWRKRR